MEWNKLAALSKVKNIKWKKSEYILLDAYNIDFG